MPFALPKDPSGNDHEVSPNDTEAPMANGEPLKPSEKDSPEGTGKQETKSTPRVRASKLEYKTVNQMYDPIYLPLHG